MRECTYPFLRDEMFNCVYTHFLAQGVAVRLNGSGGNALRCGETCCADERVRFCTLHTLTSSGGSSGDGSFFGKNGAILPARRCSPVTRSGYGTGSKRESAFPIVNDFKEQRLGSPPHTRTSRSNSTTPKSRYKSDFIPF